jgi:glycerol-3-phosphate cytidylyltransferase-like family protein
MSTVVIMPGGFHPLHAGHMALYNSAKEAFPDAQVYVAATNDTKTRPFPFAIKEKLAKVAGIDPKHFVQVKSPFQPREITDKFNPEQDVVIFVRSEKDRNESPKPGGTKKDGSPAYFQPYTGKDVQPFGQHAYMAYLPTVEFGPGITSATEIRNAWPTLNDKRKTAMVMSLYPATQKNPKLAANVVKMLDMSMGNDVAEAINKVEPISKSVPIQKTVIHPVKQHMHSPPEKKTAPAVVNHIKPRDTLKEFVPPSGDDGGGDDRSRRIRKLLEIAIQVAKQKNVDELGMIHAMNMIAGDDFFSVAVEGILPDITDKEYMFVLQSAYKTVKQGLAEAEQTARVFHPQYVDVYYLDGPRRTPLLVNRKVPYKLIDRYLELAIKKYNLQQGRFEFRNAEEDPVKVTESVDYLEEK